MIPRKRPATESYPSNAQEFAARAGPDSNRIPRRSVSEHQRKANLRRRLLLVLAARTCCDQQVQGTYHERPLFALTYADGGARERTGRGRRLTFLCAAASRRYSSAEEGVELLTIDAAGGHWNGADG